MPRFVLLLSLLITTCIVAVAQTAAGKERPDVDTWGIYTPTYTFEQGKGFEFDWEYEKAIWVYINLMGTENRPVIISRVKKLKAKVGDLEQFINITFATYAKYDPDITKKIDGNYTTDTAMLQQKRQWTNELIKAVGYPAN